MKTKPQKAERRTAKLQMPCTPREKALYEQRARESAMTLAGYMRAHLVGVIRPERPRKAG